MSLIFNLEPKPKYKSVTVFEVEIPVFGEFTVQESISVDKAIATDTTPQTTNTEWMIIQVSAWLSTRLSVPREEITAQLYKSKPLIDALWKVFVKEREGLATDYEIDEPVTEGKDDDTVPSLTSIPSGTQSTSNSQRQDLAKNSLVVLDSSVSA